MTAVVALVEHPRGVLRRYAWRYSRKKLGRVADPVRALANHGGVLASNGLLEMAVERSWRQLDPHLRWLALQAVSTSIGCSWCTDFGYYEGMQTGVDPIKVRSVPRWREASVYTDQERIVLEYAEAASATPAVIDDGLVTRLHSVFDDAQIVELASWVALENYRSRINAGLGLRSEGFAETCDVVPLGA
jgi:alkylhydroperoxidase family enzyme